MSPGNESIVPDTTQEFHCCCSLDSSGFDIDGKGVIQIINCILTVPTSLSATLGNLLVLISIWRTPSLHSPSNFLLVGLALADLGVGLVVQSLFFLCSIAKIKRLVNLFCSGIVAAFISAYWLCAVSLLTITTISLDMFMSLYLHLRYKELITAKRVTVLLVNIWVSSFAFSMLYLWYHNSLTTPFISLALLCLFITTSAYYKVFRILHRHRAQVDVQVQAGQFNDQEENSTNTAERRKSLVTMFLIYCLFLLCYLPFVVVSVVMHITGYTVIKQSIIDLSMLIVFLNSTLNPFLYCWRFQQIRIAVIETTRKIFRRNSHQ